MNFTKFTSKYFQSPDQIGQFQKLIDREEFDVVNFFKQCELIDPGPFPVNCGIDNSFTRLYKVGRLGLHACIWKNLRERFDMYYHIDKSPYIRMVFDVDILEGQSRPDLGDEIQAFLSERYDIRDTYVKTSKPNSENYHIIFTKHYDIPTYREISTLVAQTFSSSYTVIDCVETWSLPGSRGHTVPDDFFKSSPINIWTPTIVYTLLTETRIGECRAKFNGTGLLYIGSEIRDLFSLKYTSIQFSNDDEFNLVELESMIGQQFQKKAPRARGGGGVRKKAKVKQELYNSIEEARITLEKTPLDIFASFIPQDDRTVDVEMAEYEPCFKKTVSRFGDFHKDMFESQTIPWTSGMTDILKHKPRDYQWEIFYSKIRDCFVNEGTFGVMMALYRHYCTQHDLVLEANDDFAIQAILEIAINSGHVTSTLAFVLRTGMFEKNGLISSVFYLIELDISENARSILIGYISSENLPYMSSIESALLKAFRIHDFLYVLFDTKFGENGENLDLFTKICATSAKESKKQKRDDELIFYRYIMRIVPVGSDYFIFINGSYQPFVDLAFIKAHARDFELLGLGSTHGSYWYIRSGLIYYSIKQTYEISSPSFFPEITLKQDDSLFMYERDMLTTNDSNLVTFLFTLYLKADGFLKFIKKQQLALLLLGPILNGESMSPEYNDTNILTVDMRLIDVVELKGLVSKERTPLVYKFLRYLQGIVCEISESSFIDLKNPHIFISSTTIEDESSTSNAALSTEENLRKMYVEKMNTRFTLFRNILDGYLSSDFFTESHRELKKFTIGNEIKSSLNILKIDLYFNSFVPSCMEDYSPSDIDDDLFKFLVGVLSWYIRCSNNHRLLNTRFFTMLKENNENLKTEFVDLMNTIAGKRLVANNINDYALLFKLYCENTTVEIPEAFKELFPPHIKRVDVRRLDGKFAIYEKYMYIGVISFLMQSQMNIDFFIDMLKYFSGVTHKGNFRRIALALVFSSQTGKSQLIQLICECIFKSTIRNVLASNDIEKMSNDRGSLLVDELHRNLVVAIEEVSTLKPSIKGIINTDATLSGRQIFSKIQVQHGINANVIITANDSPSVSDEATSLRLLPIHRVYRYVPSVDSIYRETGIHDYTETTKYIGTQLLVERFPNNKIASDECKLGYYFVIWNMVPIFLNSYQAPVSDAISKSLVAEQEKYTLSVLPGKYFIDNGLVVPTETFIKKHEFEKQISILYNQYKSHFVGSPTLKSTCEYIFEMLKSHVHGDCIYAKVVVRLE